MSFPTLSEVDLMLFEALTTADEQAGIYTTRDGAETPARGMLNELDPVRYADYGTVVLASSRELLLLRADVAAPKSGDTWTCGASIYRLQEPVFADAGQTRWLVVLERTTP